jgi:hypothetical protein
MARNCDPAMEDIPTDEWYWGIKIEALTAEIFRDAFYGIAAMVTNQHRPT